MFNISNQRAKLARADISLENARSRYEKVSVASNAQKVAKALRDAAKEWDKLANMMIAERK